MIESIAFQTNIMALNANVEAAHAGDSGRGFAVVATEISNMSTQTKEATDNISDLIHNATTSLDDLVASVTEMSTALTSEALSKEHANAESVSNIAEQIGSLAQNE